MSILLTRRAPNLTLRLTKPFHSISRDPDLEIDTFGNLAPWATTHLHEPAPPLTILIRHHESRPYTVQRALLSHATKKSSLVDEEEIDLTSFPTQAGLTFLFWLFHRRLPLERDTSLPAETSEPAKFSTRQKGEMFTNGLIASWTLGSFLRAARFQDDCLRLAAKKLYLEEAEVLEIHPFATRTSNPHRSSLIRWSREAFDYSCETDVEESNLREFAVDVAAKRVYEVGMNGLTLDPEERDLLSSNGKFAAEVFASLGGQIGTKGVRIQDFAKAYLIGMDVV